MSNQAIRLVALMIATLLCGTARSQIYTWDGDSNGAIDNGLNWVGDIAPNLDLFEVPDLVFAGTNNTTVNLRSGTDVGDAVTSVTFDPSAGSFTIADPEGIGNFLWISEDDSDLTGVNNNSPNLQTFAAPVRLQSTTVTTAVGQIAFTGLVTLAGTNTFDTTADVTISGGLESLSGNTNINKRGEGTLILSGPSTFNGQVVIGSATGDDFGPFGAVRIMHDQALGSDANNTNNQTRLFGNRNSGGRLELAGGITTNERIYINGRQADQADKPAIWNYSDDNTMTGRILLEGGGGRYNFGSASGKLNIAGEASVTSSLGGSRVLSFYGAGDGEFSGQLGANNATSGSLQIHHRGTGTLTLSAPNNWRLGHLVSMGGGTLRIASTFGNTEPDQESYPLFAPNDDAYDDLDDTDDENDVPNPQPIRLHVTSGSTLDVSDWGAGGYTLDRVFSGSGQVAGNLVVTTGGAVHPGSEIETYVNDSLSIEEFNPGTGTLNFQNNLDLSTGGELVWNLSSLTTDGAGTNFDQLIVGGDLLLGGSSTLSLDFSLLGGDGPDSANPFWSTGHSWKIIDTTTNTANATFANLLNAEFSGGSFSTSVDAGGDIFLNYSTGSDLLVGDYNDDGVVNAADYVVWRNNLGQSATALENRDPANSGLVSVDDYLSWKNHYGQVGGALQALPAANVPEPGTALLLVCGLVAAGRAAARRRRALR